MNSATNGLMGSGGADKNVLKFNGVMNAQLCEYSKKPLK